MYSTVEKAYNFLKETGLIKLFSKEDFIALYKKNPDIYYDLDEGIFLNVACKINNKSPEILLERNNSTKLHIQYRDPRWVRLRGWAALVGDTRCHRLRCSYGSSPAQSSRSPASDCTFRTVHE